MNKVFNFPYRRITTALMLLSFSMVSIVILMPSCKSRHQEKAIKAKDTYEKMPPIRFKFFLERSGSMTPFDATTTTGDFKSALTSFLNSIPDGKARSENLLFIVNDAVYPFDKSYKEFIQSKNIFADTKNVGDPRYTDFTCIFDSILAKTISTVGCMLSMLIADISTTSPLLLKRSIGMS